MKLPLSWSRTLTFTLLCALAFAPGAMHARICLVALGVFEKSNCCEVMACCADDRTDSPSVNAGVKDCHCCIDVVLDSTDKTPLETGTTNDSHLDAAPAHLSEILPPLLPPPGLERAQCIFARAGPRPRMAAPLPLRI